jgi:hypothetical protein
MKIRSVAAELFHAVAIYSHVYMASVPTVFI